MKRNQYVDSVIEKIERVRADETIRQAAVKIAEVIEENGTLYTFGASHAGILSEELFYRAGGLALFNPIMDPNLMLDTRPVTKTSASESLEGYGELIGKHVPFKKGDLLLAHSVSGRNPVMIDLVQHAKSLGVYVIGITNMTYSKETKSRHSTGLRLFELADLVIDNHGETGDATVRFEGLPQAVAPTSTVVGATIVNCLLVEIVEALIEKGIEPPIFYSANLDGTKKKNEEIFSKYKEQIHYN